MTFPLALLSNNIGFVMPLTCFYNCISALLIPALRLQSNENDRAFFFFMWPNTATQSQRQNGGHF